MIYKLTKRGRLQDSDWLRQIKTLAWRDIQKPSPDGLGIQAADLTRPIEGDSIARRIRELFLNIAAKTDDPVAAEGEMASGIHKLLDGITYREASDPDMWAHLVAFGCPEYPRWRWSDPKADLKNRYAGSIRRNAFAALWWWAEVTHDPAKSLDDPSRYAHTRIVKGRTTFVLYCVDCIFSGHQLLVRNLCRIQESNKLGDTDSGKLCRSVNRMARMVCLDQLKQEPEMAVFGDQALKLSQQLR